MIKHRFPSIVFLWFALHCCEAGTAQLVNGVIYVDASGGDDSNDGHTEKTAWQTLEKVNQPTFGPGAKILLKCGSMWIGQLHPKGSGSAQQPILIDQYGKGQKPLIDGNGMTGEGVFSLYNQQYWEVNNLELVNDANVPGDRRGVEIKAGDFGIVNHIYLKNLDIHHIKGIIGNGPAEKRTAGIYITTVADKVKPTRYNDILIEGCHIHHIQNQGIATSHEAALGDYPGEDNWDNRKITNLIIRNNTIHHISKNAMIIRMTEGGLVEHNLCYETATAITGNTIFSRTVKGTVFQYNEGFLNRSPDADGSLYDPDINSPGTVWQYSYSHDNAHGLVWFCTDKRDSGILVRYNVSQNDKGSLVYFNYNLAEASIYNNIFYVGEHVAPMIIREKPTNTHTYKFYNNIIYNNSNSAVYGLATAGKGIQNRIYSNNLFYGYHPKGEPDDAEKITSDPLFLNPGEGSIGLTTLEGYKLKINSPAIHTGKVIVGNGGLDFYGNKLSEKEKPNRGIYNGAALTVNGECQTITAAGYNYSEYDLYLLVGQSNMAGRGKMEAPDTLLDERVFVLNSSDGFVLAKEPLHYDKANRGTGPGFAFGKEMANTDQHRRVGLIPAAVGGTRISYWLPGGSRGLYEEAIRKAKVAMKYGKLKGILWQQGESDANPKDAPLYKERLVKLLQNFRKELGNDTLPIVLGGLGDFLKAPEYKIINKSLLEVANEIGFAAFSKASTLGHIGDYLHFNASAQRENGHTMAKAMQRIK
jgi:Carbohydrate esterase, sialic acid-specific acetylesterase